MPADLVDVVEMAKCRITLDKQLRESDREMQKTLCELQASRDAGLEPPHLPLSKSKEVRSGCQQLASVEKQMYLALEKVSSVEVTIFTAAVRLKKELLCLSSGSVKVLHKEREVMTTKVED